jgi:hypothetical protein
MNKTKMICPVITELQICELMEHRLINTIDAMEYMEHMKRIEVRQQMQEHVSELFNKRIGYK